MSRRALVTGVSGQDGAYLARALLKDGMAVFGTLREGTNEPEALRSLGLEAAVELLLVDLGDEASIRAAVDRARPHEVYHLAASSSVAASWSDPVGVADTNALGTIRLLAALRETVPEVRLVNASSSEIFAHRPGEAADEDTSFAPSSPYGAAKLHAHLAVRQQREAHGLHAANAILFNHESPLRGPRFVTRKITMALARIAQGADEVLALGNIDAARDWGDAEDYVEAMMRMARAATPCDYVISTGTAMRVRDFVEAAAGALDLSITWKGKGLEETGHADGRCILRIDPQFFRPMEAEAMVGNAGRVARELGWRARSDARDVAIRMALADRDLLRAGRAAKQTS